MIYIKRKEVPEFWHRFQTKNPTMRYDDLQNSEEGKAIRQKLREFNIEQQHGLCAYCCREIDLHNSLNEHIKPRGLGKYSNQSMDYTNIVASCDKEGKEEATCSAHKKNDYDEKFVSPLDSDCEKYFEYYPNGEVVSDSDKGKYTIDLLNLNSYRLRQARAARLRICESYKDLTLIKQVFIEPNADHKLESFTDIVRYFYANNLFAFNDD